MYVFGSRPAIVEPQYHKADTGEGMISKKLAESVNAGTYPRLVVIPGRYRLEEPRLQSQRLLLHRSCIRRTRILQQMPQRRLSNTNKKKYGLKRIHDLHHVAMEVIIFWGGVNGPCNEGNPIRKKAMANLI